MVVPYFEFTVMNNEKLLLAKAWDNRIGIAIAIDVLKALKDESIQTLFDWGRVKKKLVFVVHVRQLQKFNQILDLPWTSELLGTRLELQQKKHRQNGRWSSNCSL